MSNQVILKELSVESIEAVHFFVSAGIRRLERAGWPREQIIIQAPKYFMELLHRKIYPTVSISLVDGKWTFFGKKVVPSFSNKIVIYHEDMPLFREDEVVIVHII